MLTGYLKRGLITGLIGGIFYGTFIAFVFTPLIRHIETFESGHQEAAVTEIIATVASIGAGVTWGLLLGLVVFGAGYFFLEPAIPGQPDTKSYLLGAGGFITISGAPWLLLPPLPPGVETALPTSTRILWYSLMMLSGAITCGLAGYIYRLLRARQHVILAIAGGITPFFLLTVPVVLAPANPTTGPVPPTLTVAFTGTVITGQVGLWIVLGGTHAWLINRVPPWSEHGTTSYNPALSLTDT